LLLALLGDAGGEAISTLDPFLDGDGPITLDELRAANRGLLDEFGRRASVIRAVTKAAAYDEQIARLWNDIVGRIIDAARRRLELHGRTPQQAQALATTLVWRNERTCLQQAVHRSTGLTNDDALAALDGLVEDRRGTLPPPVASRPHSVRSERDTALGGRAVVDAGHRRGTASGPTPGVGDTRASSQCWVGTWVSPSLGTRRTVRRRHFQIRAPARPPHTRSLGSARGCARCWSQPSFEKVLPRFGDLGVFLQLLPRSSTGERMNPYTSLWTGVTPGDGPQTFHLVLLDAGRTKVLADPVGRDALRCIRCSACLNVCPVYERTGGHAYEHTYPGPIGAILAPQLEGIDVRPDLPFASSLCGACYEVCPVKIDIPSILVHLRGQAPKENAEQLAMRALARVFQHRRRYERAQKLARLGAKPLSRDRRIECDLPGPLHGWLAHRDLQVPSEPSFREWWAKERGDA